MKKSEQQHIRDLVTADKLSDALQKLTEVRPFITVWILQYRLNRCKKQEQRGVLNTEASNLERNKIIEAILELLEPTYYIYVILRILPRMLLYCVGLFLLLYVLSLSDCKGTIIQPLACNAYKNPNEITKKLPVTINNAFIAKKIISKDKAGKEIEYIVFIIRDYTWERGGLAIENRSKKVDLEKELAENGINAQLNNESFKGIVCFGNTSYEEPHDAPDRLKIKIEEDRADLRAKFLANCVKKALTKSPQTPILISNLGKYNQSDTISTYQRQVILIGILRQDDGVISQEAFFNGLMDWHKNEDWEIDISNFSKVKNNQIELLRYY